MGTYNLFALIGDRLQLFSNEFSMPLYNTLYEILVERTVNQVSDLPHAPPDVTHHIENPRKSFIRTLGHRCQLPVERSVLTAACVDLCQWSSRSCPL